jgi:hypothetical protein
MPINLSDYTPAMRKFIHDRDMACVYGTSDAGQTTPCRLASAVLCEAAEATRSSSRSSAASTAMSVFSHTAN